MDKETARSDWSGSEKEKIFMEPGEEASVLISIDIGLLSAGVIDSVSSDSLNRVKKCLNWRIQESETCSNTTSHNVMKEIFQARITSNIQHITDHATFTEDSEPRETLNLAHP
ncbi:hypothetical protein RRG08_048979 [Elysia crispata]|uniref:Uncharacterized protein n=1 Tax=Elysia crispata TaxID=231223 RepID=A0AAE0YCB3_9GAST|nr:hypothetical protein RRG08_048979 [Elysia crispata]